MIREDAWLRAMADVLDDLEQTRMANENRLRTLVQDGHGGTDQAATVEGLVAVLYEAEKRATRALQKTLRQHPLHPWIARTRGVGEKQGARLLAAIGDPYWHVLENRPRRVAELWAYCGLHTLSVDHGTVDTQAAFIDGDQLGNPDQPLVDAQPIDIRIAARRQRGARANWSAEAKMRARLVAESMLKAGNRALYDERKAKTEGKLHDHPCAPCGTKGKPAAIGTPWKDGHRHADALRIVAKKAILKELWREARRLHEFSISDQITFDDHGRDIADRNQLPVDQARSDAHMRYVDRNQFEEPAA